MNKTRLGLGAFALATALIAAPSVAMASDVQEDNTPYILVAWSVTNPDNVFEKPQTLAQAIDLETPTLDALDEFIGGKCGYFQIDLNYDTPEVRETIAGGVLYGPGDPHEDLAYGKVSGDPYKYLEGTNCETEPTPTPTPTDTSTPTPTPTPTDTATPTPTPSDSATPTPEPVSSETPAPPAGEEPIDAEPVAADVAAGPQLANTGVEDYAPAAALAFALILGGAYLFSRQHALKK